MRKDSKIVCEDIQFSLGNWNKNCKHGCNRKGNVHPIYEAWHSMKGRCYTPTNSRFKHYGGRGIIVCERWKCSFINFLEDMGASYFDGAQMNRIDNNGNYEPSNCKWSDRFEQANNKTNNRRLISMGYNLTLAQWVRKTGLAANTISNRLRRGWSIERALTTAPLPSPFKTPAPALASLPR